MDIYYPLPLPEDLVLELREPELLLLLLELLVELLRLLLDDFEVRSEDLLLLEGLVVLELLLLEFVFTFGD